MIYFCINDVFQISFINKTGPTNLALIVQSQYNGTQKTTLYYVVCFVGNCENTATSDSTETEMTTSEIPSKLGQTTIIIVIIVLAAIIAIALIVVGILWWKRKHKTLLTKQNDLGMFLE